MAQQRDALGVHHIDPTKQFELESPAEDEEETRSHSYSPGLLWAGGAATAFVAGLLAVVGILTARALLDIAVPAPQGHGAWGGATTVAYTLVAAGRAFAAPGLLQLMLTTTPDAVRFFTWIILLLAAVTAVLPLGLEAETGSRVATATLNALIGIAIAISLRDVARRSRR